MEQDRDAQIAEAKRRMKRTAARVEALKASGVGDRVQSDAEAAEQAAIAAAWQPLQMRAIALQLQASTSTTGDAVTFVTPPAAGGDDDGLAGVREPRPPMPTAPAAEMTVREMRIAKTERLRRQFADEGRPRDGDAHLSESDLAAENESLEAGYRILEEMQALVVEDD